MSPLDVDDGRVYPCSHPGCTTMRSVDEGGLIFTVCDEHWMPDDALEAMTTLAANLRDAGYAQRAFGLGWDLCYGKHLWEPGCRRPAPGRGD